MIWPDDQVAAGVALLGSLWMFVAPKTHLHSDIGQKLHNTSPEFSLIILKKLMFCLF